MGQGVRTPISIYWFILLGSQCFYLLQLHIKRSLIDMLWSSNYQLVLTKTQEILENFKTDWFFVYGKSNRWEAHIKIKIRAILKIWIMACQKILSKDVKTNLIKCSLKFVISIHWPRQARRGFTNGTRISGFCKMLHLIWFREKIY